MRHSVCVTQKLLALLIWIPNARAQSPSPRPQFEVATVKPNPGEMNFANCAGDGPAPGRLVMKCSTL
jgi:hypothetical protein